MRIIRFLLWCLLAYWAVKITIGLLIVLSAGGL